MSARDTAINVLARVEAAMASDTEDPVQQSGYLVEAYERATASERAVVDEVFAALCGYSLRTILAGEGDEDEEPAPAAAASDETAWLNEGVRYEVKQGEDEEPAS